MRRLFIVPLLLAVMLFTACPQGLNIQNVAVASHDASVVVKTFQDSEIQLYNAKLISNEDHKTIQGLLYDISQVGLTLDKDLRACKDNPSAKKVVQIAIADLDQVQAMGMNKIRDKDTQMKFILTITGVKAALSTINSLLQ